ncbi:MAG TPA: phosphoribosylanthranilate isomerase [bacterium]|nr:phosphoribosylanthranilate isomerase [bacterium]
MFRVKICGVTRAQDVRVIAKAGADAIGFQMSMGPRKITPEEAKRLVKLVPPLVTPVGVFVNEALSRVKKLIKLCGFQAVQLHGDEPDSYCRQIEVPVLKVVRMKKPNVYKGFQGFQVAAFLLDSYNKNQPGGTGESFQTKWARRAVQELPAPVLLAGGLTPDNVQRAIRSSHAFGVDVASGVETRPGVKDSRQVFLFVRRAKKVFLG